MRRKIGMTCMTLGAVLVLIALSLFFWNRQEDKKAGQSAELILPKIVAQAESDSGENASGSPDLYGSDMKSVEIDGYGFIGYLTIPDLNLELPVMSEWDYVRMKRSPCRYAGSVKTDDLVIAAHNYTRHFGRLSKLSEGDIIYFTDMDGNRYSYSVKAVEVLPPTAVEEMTSGDYELTLFTCTYSGQSRLAVRCSRASEK